MSVVLLPRLTRLGVAIVLETFGEHVITPERARAALDDTSSTLWYAASGGHRDQSPIDRIGNDVRRLARDSGFPDNPSRVARTKFDRDATVLLASSEVLSTGEALRDDAWSYITAVALPDVVAWRFPGKAAHRFEGGVRNALQRLWVRGTVLDRGPGSADRWGLVNSLNEDAAVQIFERASIAGNRRLAVALAEGRLRAAEHIERSRMEDVMRCATRLVRLRNEVFDLAGMTDSQRDALVDSCFESAVASTEN